MMNRYLLILCILITVGTSASASQINLSSGPKNSVGDELSRSSLPVGSVVEKESLPQYPYPQYHNPFYDGRTINEYFSGTWQWVRHLPWKVVDGLTGVLDKKIFSKAGQPQGEVITREPKGAQAAGNISETDAGKTKN